MTPRKRPGGQHLKKPETAPAGDPHRLTPPCTCGYPLLKSDKECPRCKRPTPWANNAAPIGTVDDESTPPGKDTNAD